jgi:crotonobetainyl-CoA:carnitine CoA-transferase CaiB-like acyl-CoA transferase
MNLNMPFLTGLMRNPATIADNIQLLGHVDQVLRRFIGGKGKWEVYEGAQRRRLLFGIVSTPEDLAENPQLLHRQWLTPVEHPDLQDTLQYPGPPYRLSETPWAIRGRPPLIGEHNAEIYSGELGLKAEDLERLSAASAI